MRQLTFDGYVKQYVSQLSLYNATAASQLTVESIDANPRLREPLAIHAVVNRHGRAVLNSAAGTSVSAFYEQYVLLYTRDKMLRELEDGSPSLPDGFHKVWRSYQAERQKSLHDKELKALFRARILELKKDCPVSTYRLCKELHLNNANVCTWLRTGDPQMVTLAAARQIYRFLSDFCQA